MKKRFELFGNCFNNWIEDHLIGKAYQGLGVENLLNEQDEKIKELEETLKLLKITQRYDISELMRENVKLKETQNQKAIECLEKVKETLIQNADEIGEEYREDYFMINLGNVKRIIDSQISELKGNENE